MFYEMGYVCLVNNLTLRLDVGLCTFVLGENRQSGGVAESVAVPAPYWYGGSNIVITDDNISSISRMMIIAMLIVILMMLLMIITNYDYHL